MCLIYHVYTYIYIYTYTYVLCAMVRCWTTCEVKKQSAWGRQTLEKKCHGWLQTVRIGTPASMPFIHRRGRRVGWLNCIGKKHIFLCTPWFDADQILVFQFGNLLEIYQFVMSSEIEFSGYF